ncbi:TPA: phage holin family protein [Streptococcus equi subsp. equi]|uniref:phage holin family protein n=1 Tax=Streptococcus equi TaxID=1336 RepID=UPI0013F69E0B|nr:phage holin family protein [Streptococcus equi]MBT1199209.1 phage holin family protein [Streptococcus equi subsp. equi]MBT1201046.1 phage holin family protein [Streptococcus equi subsp. equi]MBT1211454.1 phage holin family protein [Streptococcus equi subsp. equi]MCD3433663.1 phage holin family protein [Streptococcus equi subsp. zooepidemicus]MCD3462307.1 phage holin family protein [Streptococcus equi subsp. zooepidemicus]
MFIFLRQLIQTQDGKILFTLGAIAVAMMIDFLTGTVAAKINPNIDFRSKEGINGILRKICSIALMIFFIPLSILLPNDTGVAFLYVMYVGYLLFELKSIIENLNKMGIDVALFKQFIDMFSKK